MLRICANYVVIFYTFIGCISGANIEMRNQVVIDVSQVVKEAFQPGLELAAKNTIQSILKTHGMNNNNFTLFYETEMTPFLDNELGNVTMLLKDIDSSARLLVSIKVQWPETKDDEKVDMNIFTALIDALRNYSSLIAGISFEMSTTQVEQICKDKIPRATVDTTFFEKLKNKAKQTNPEFRQNSLQVGYALKRKHHSCSVHAESKRHADFLIVNLPLRRNDNIFVESYGMFKKKVGRLVYEVVNEIKNIFENTFTGDVYFRPILKVGIDASKIGTFVGEDGYTVYQANPYDQSLVNETMDKLDEMKKLYVGNYGNLLSQYCHELVKSSDFNRNIILDYKFVTTLPEIPQNNESYKKTMPIPFLTEIPVWSSKNIKAVSFLLKDVAASGFNDVMINGDAWQAMVQHKSLPPCVKPDCRPANVLYMNNQNNAFLPSIEIKKLVELSGMKLSTVVFSTDYTESKSNNWDELARSFKKSADNMTTDASITHNVEIGCIEGDGKDVFVAINRHEGCDNTCAALLVRTLKGCRSIGNTSTTILWRGLLKLEKENMKYFAENTMKRLDVLLIARTMLNIEKPNTKVILLIKVEAEIANSQGIPISLYCSKPTEQVAQLYEMILTWASIFDFSIIFYYNTKILGFSSPTTWQQLHGSADARMWEMMLSAPLFIRRNYLQSGVYNSWSKGMYPCLPYSEGQVQSLKSLLDLNSNNHVGVTLNMDLRREGTPLINSNELQTILLFAVGRFSAIEITIAQVTNLQTLAEVISHPSFANNLKENKIEGKKIYLHFKITALQMVSEKNLINELTFNLHLIGFQVHIHFSCANQDLLIFLKNDTGSHFGCVLKSCTTFAHDLIFWDMSQYNVSNMAYLVCETYPMSANNTDKKLMQDHLHSYIYLKKLFHHLFPNLKEIHFRLTPQLSGTNSEMKDLHLLRFLADVTNFAREHQVHIFPLSVLPHEQDDQAEASFWIVNTYNNLSDPSNYQERPAQYLNQNMWEPKILYDINNDTVTKADDHILELPEIVFYVLAPVILISFIVTILLALKYWSQVDKCRRKKPKKEVANESVAVVNEETLQVSQTEFRDEKDKKSELGKKMSDKVKTTNKPGISSKSSSKKSPHINIRSNKHPLEEIKLNKRENKAQFLQTSENYNEIAKENINIHFDQILGSGQFGIVYRAQLQYENFDDDDVAIKMLHDDSPNESWKGMWGEIQLLSKIGYHCNVVRFIGCYSSEVKDGVLWIVTELCTNGSLISYLRNFDVPSDTLERPIYEELLRFSFEIASGMEYIATKNIIHGDLAARNVLLDVHKTCKIGDFGLSRKMYTYEMYTKTSQEPLPWRWMAYEALAKLQFSTQSDIWSYGVTLWEIFTFGYVPYPGLVWSVEFVNELKNGLRLPIPCHASPDTYEIMKKCWRLEQKDRPTFSEFVVFFNVNPRRTNDVTVTAIPSIKPQNNITHYITQTTPSKF